ncbi:MAG: hypothetical protein LM593_02555 [Candidatus Verstraetearchaeota archaeon]|jgi:hypothetical protein|nr:hypothetical protein [Candidatus Verstraetearchaeota archaeon]
MHNNYDQLIKFSYEISQLVKYIYFNNLARAEEELIQLKNKLEKFGEMGNGFFNAIKGIYIAMKEKDKIAFFTRIYQYETPEKIREIANNFKNEMFRPTIDDYERGFLLCWEIILRTLSELKEKYPEYVKGNTELTSK